MTRTYTIYALLIGINNYPNPGHRLKGCVADVESVHEYLQTFCLENKLELKVQILTDEAATRDGVINGFEHFQAATDKDFCLFHYSGHGSRSLAPREFLHLESDGYIESLVCHDSRISSRDLMNKELSWLIWNVTKDKPNLPFISIMDCCHSGKITRTRKDIEEIEEQTRTIGESDKKFKANTILGFEDYKVDGDRRYTPPIGRQILLAASRDKQTAKEVKVKGVKRGIFTYFIIEQLKQHNGKLTYGELIDYLSPSVKNYVSKQNPQVVSTVSYDKKNYFLTKEEQENNNTYLLSWNDKSKEWQLNAGAMQGVLMEIEDKLPQFRLLGSDDVFESEQVYANHTVVKNIYQLDQSKSYKICEVLPTKWIYISKQIDEKWLKLLHKAIKNISFPIQLTKDTHQANYQIITNDDNWIFQTYNEPYTFPKILFTSEVNESRLFVKKIITYFNWRKVLELDNPNSKIPNTVLDIDLSKIVEKETVEITRITSSKTVINIDYDKTNGAWQIPEIQLKIKNSSSQSYWVSVCYLGVDYSIQNDLVDIQELGRNEVVQARQVDEQSYLNDEIQLSLPKSIFEKSTDEITVYLKVFISKSAFSTDILNQKGIYDKPTRKGFSNNFISISDDWTTKTIQIKLKRSNNG